MFLTHMRRKRCAAALIANMLFSSTLMARPPAEPSGSQSIGSSPSAKGSQTTSGSADAKQLVAASKDSVALIIQTARQSPDPLLARSKSTAKPFWNALKQLNEAVDRVDRGFFLQDKTFTTSLGDTVTAVVQTDVGFKNSGSGDTAVQQAIRKSMDVIEALAVNYGELAQRLKKGGKLSAAELQQLQALRAKQTELENRLTSMEAELAKQKNHNKKALKGVAELRKELKDAKRRTQGNTAAAFVGGVFAGHVLSGMCWGWHWWWGPWWGSWGPAFFVSYTEVYIDAVDIIDVDMDWDLMDEAIELDDYDITLDEFDGADSIADSMDNYIEDVEPELPAIDAADYDALEANTLDSDTSDTMLDDGDYNEPGDYAEPPAMMEHDMGGGYIDDFGGFDDFGDY